MKNFKKVVNPCKADEGQMYVEIVFKDGNLSLHGVVAPMSNGNCKGSCGQNSEELLMGKPNDGWTKDSLKELYEVWERYHLNDMNPYCEHQRELWADDLKNPKTLTKKHYSLNVETLTIQSNINQSVMDRLKNGETVKLTEDELQIVRLTYSFDTYNTIHKDLEKYYELDKETQASALHTYHWETDDGILCKPCPVCGYKYGSELKKEEVPQDILEYLFNLPDTKTTPAWV